MGFTPRFWDLGLRNWLGLASSPICRHFDAKSSKFLARVRIGGIAVPAVLDDILSTIGVVRECFGAIQVGQSTRGTNSGPLSRNAIRRFGPALARIPRERGAVVTRALDVADRDMRLVLTIGNVLGAALVFFGTPQASKDCENNQYESQFPLS